MNCKVTNNPDPVINYRWFIVETNQTLSTSSSFQLTPNKTQNGQTLSCSADNGYGSRKSDAVILDVQYGPEVHVSISRIDIIESDKLVINCSVMQSKPDDASINWYKPDGTSISSNILSIDNTRRDQGGIYSCNSSKVLRPSIGTTKTNVDSKTTIVNIWYLDPVKITTDKLEMQEGDTINITCTTQSNPTASITYRNGSDVIQTDNSNQASFIKLAATCLDTNVYSCQVNNPKIPQTSYNDTIQILVYCSPRRDPRVDHQYKIIGNIGDSVELTAQVISYPKPIFQWYYRENNVDIPIVNNGSFQQTDISTNINTFISTLTINITTNKFYRRYHLNVSNEVIPRGSDLQYDIILEPVPERPFNIIYNVTTDTICIEWTPGFNGGAPQSFIVQHSTDDKTWVNSSTIPDDTNNGRVEYCIEGLEPDTSYYIRVIASNKYGESLIGTLSQSELPKTLPIQVCECSTDFNSVYNSGFGAGIGTGFGISIALVVMVIMSLYIYKYWTGKQQKEDQMYDSVNSRTRADDSQTYQELDTIPHTNPTQTDDVVHYNNTGVNQRRRDDDVAPYANLRTQTGGTSML